MSGDLAGWLLTQISEDERTVRYASINAVRGGIYLNSDGYVIVDHRRILAECAAKRAIIGQLDRNVRDAPNGWLDQVLLLLAAPYSDRPGFRPEWQVTP